MELSRLKRPFAFEPCRGLSHVALMLAMLLAAPAWFGTESDETSQQEVKKCSEVLAYTSQGRRREIQPACATYFRSGLCLSQACLVRRKPAPQSQGHRLSHELLAPLTC